MSVSIQTHMTKNFSNGNTIWKDAFTFHEDYEPDIIPYRDDEINKLIGLLKGVYEGQRAIIDVNGSTGTGKTLSVKKIIGEFKKKATVEKKNMAFVFVKCGETTTQSQILKHIAQEICGEEKVGKGTGDYLNRIRKKKKELDSIVIVLDEIDKVVKRSQEREVLFILADEPIFNLITISNIPDWQKKYISDRSVVSRSVSSHSLLFYPYKEPQILGILKQRAEHGLMDNTYTDDILKHIAKKVANRDGDMREAVGWLFKAGKTAELAGKPKIEIDDVNLSDAKFKDDETISYLENQSITKKLLVCVVYHYWITKGTHPNKTEVCSLYNSLTKNHSEYDIMKEGSVRIYLSELCQYEYLIRISGRGRGRGMGKEQTTYKLNMDEKEFKEKFYNKYWVK